MPLDPAWFFSSHCRNSADDLKICIGSMGSIDQVAMGAAKIGRDQAAAKAEPFRQH
jgi:hypothetical protein